MTIPQAIIVASVWLMPSAALLSRTVSSIGVWVSIGVAAIVTACVL